MWLVMVRGALGELALAWVLKRPACSPDGSLQPVEQLDHRNGEEMLHCAERGDIKYKMSSYFPLQWYISSLCSAPLCVTFTHIHSWSILGFNIFPKDTQTGQESNHR